MIVIGLEMWMIEIALRVFFFYMGDTTFTWNSKKQSIVILLTREDEYVATTTCHCHSI